jgi:YihY family inner membrane protein
MAHDKQVPDINAPGEKFPEVIQSINKEVKPQTTFLSKFRHDRSPILAKALAYSLLTAMFSILLVLLAVLDIVLRRLGPHVQDEIITYLKGIFPRTISSGDIIRTIFYQLSRVSGFSGIIVIILAILVGSRLFILIEKCLNIIYCSHSRKFFARNLIAIGMVLLFIVLSLIMILASSLSPFALALVKRTPVAHVPAIGYLFSLAAVLSSLVVAGILFQTIYMVMPNRRITFSKSWQGTLVAAGALQIYLSLFPFYATRFLGGYIGQVGFAIMLLAFFYYFGLILLLGAEVNAYFSEGIRTTNSHFNP